MAKNNLISLMDVSNAGLFFSILAYLMVLSTNIWTTSSPKNFSKRNVGVKSQFAYWFTMLSVELSTGVTSLFTHSLTGFSIILDRFTGTSEVNLSCRLPASLDCLHALLRFDCLTSVATAGE